MIAESCVQFSGYNPKQDVGTSIACPILTGSMALQKTWKVGIDWPEGPPVPIPNTEVKLRFVDDSMRATACENR